MSADTKIEWTRNDDGSAGRTWNPVTGCTKVSDGCKNCYAETIAERFRGHAAFPHGFDVQIRASKVNDPLRWRKPTRVFVNSMSDLFHAEVARGWIEDIFAVMAAARRHTFQLLTKRHGRMLSLLTDPAFVEAVRQRALGKGLPAEDWMWPLPNLWLGVSVENQTWANVRIPALLRAPAAVKFLSCEPLLGPVDLTRIPFRGDTAYVVDALRGRYGQREPKELFCFGMAGLTRISWVIVGGESGHKARPMDPNWARSLRDQCAKARVAFFYKQWGEWAPSGAVVIRNRTEPNSVLVGDPVDEWGHRVEMRRVGKAQAGRLLDGVEHNAFPAVD